MSHGRQHHVSPNCRILVSILQKQAFWNLGRQALSHRRQPLVSSNFRMLVFAISKQVFWNLGRQAVVSHATMLSPQISECLPGGEIKKLQKYNLLLSAIDYTLHQVVCHPIDNTNTKHFNLSRNLKNINISN